MKKIAILGSTGSIGTQALDIVGMNPDRYQIEVLTCRGQVDLLLQQIEQFQPKQVVVETEAGYQKVKEACQGKPVEVHFGFEGLCHAAENSDAEVVLTSLVGSVGLVPTLKAIDAGKTIALANKETLVTAGQLVMKKAREKGVAILPVDSEHSAIFQALQGNDSKSVEKLILTASGGPFRGLEKEIIANKKAADALKHPNWAMGAKITIDSATLMNKGLEVIEAKWLFDVNPSQIEVVVHPQSIIHSMVAYKDSSIIAQMGLPDMRLPIHYAFHYPGRLEIDLPKLSFLETSTLTFETPNRENFPCLQLAFDALEAGGTMACVLNAANEVLVQSYLEGSIGFYDIPSGIAQMMDRHQPIQNYCLEDLLDIDERTRLTTKEWIENRK